MTNEQIQKTIQGAWLGHCTGNSIKAYQAYDWDKALSFLVAAGCDGTAAMKYLLRFSEQSNVVYIHLQTDGPVI